MENEITKKLNDFFFQFQKIKYKKGEVILRAEDDPSGVFYVTNGYVRFYSISEDGKELTLNIFKPGSYFPVLWALGDIPNVYFFETMTPAEVWRAPRERLLEFIMGEKGVLYELTKRLLVGLGGLLVHMEFLLRGDAHQKVVSVLCLCARRFGKKTRSGKMVIDLPLTHQDIANMAGLTRETTSLEVKKLERNGVISRKKRLWIIDDCKKLQEESLIHFDSMTLPYTF